MTHHMKVTERLSAKATTPADSLFTRSAGVVYCFVYSILGTSCLIRSAFVSSRLISTTNSSAEAKSLILGVFPFISFAFLHCAAVFQTKPYLKYPLHLSLISDVLFKWLIGTICGIETPPLYDLIVPCVQ